MLSSHLQCLNDARPHGVAGSVVTRAMGPEPPVVSTEGLPTLSSAITPAAVNDAEPFSDRLKWVLALKFERLTSTTAFGPPASVFCLAVSPATAEPTTRFIVLVSVAVAPLSANKAAKGKETPGLLAVLPNTEALVVELPSLPCRWMPALPQLVMVLFWIS